MTSIEQGLAMRGAKVTVHRHGDARLELRWQGKILAFERRQRPSRQNKKVEQSATVDGKELNTRVNTVLTKRDLNVLAKKHLLKTTAQESRCVS